MMGVQDSPWKILWVSCNVWNFEMVGVQDSPFPISKTNLDTHETVRARKKTNLDTHETVRPVI
jgi:hypothetical protein